MPISVFALGHYKISKTEENSIKIRGIHYNNVKVREMRRKKENICKS